MSDRVQDKHSWARSVALLPAIGVFRGQSGDNREHRHWAHQLSVGLDSDIEVIADGVCHCAKALFILAGTPHRLVANSVLSVYLDPPSAIARAVCNRIDCGSRIVELPENMAVLLCGLFDNARSLEDGLENFLKAFQVSDPRIRPQKLDAVLEMLNRGVPEGRGADRAHLAKVAGLSESRFSHWFREQTGLPLRSYRKWLRLIFGLDLALKGSTLTDAAHIAQFSDQAHFTRTFVQMFGVRPSDVIERVTPLKADRRR